MMYVRHILAGLIFGILGILGLFIYPFIYPFFDSIYWKEIKPLWYLINSDEPDLKQNKYGADWWRRKKGIRLNRWWKRFFASYRWNAIRNPHYNLKLTLVPRLGTPYKIKIYYDTTGEGGMVFCNENVTGKQFATFEVEGQRQFMISATFKLLWWIQNYQFGMSDKRYIYKIRFWNKKDIKL